MDDRARKYAIIAAIAVAGIAAVAMVASYPQPQNVTLDIGQDNNPAPSQTGGLAVPNAGKEQDLSENAPDQVMIPATISVTPIAALAGSQATVSGSGFSPGSPITLSLDSSAAQPTPARIVADGSGTFSAIIDLTQAHAGDHNLSAHDASGKSASAILSVR
ncbi:MAG: hypothetical protein ABI347_05015 [Nitrososphaera sp.]|jgi:hypothetical protein